MIAENMKPERVPRYPRRGVRWRSDVTNVMAARERAKDEFERTEGTRLTPLAFALKAVAESPQEQPYRPTRRGRAMPSC